MTERKLLFSYDSGDDGCPNIIRVYDDNTYTADGRHGDVMYWKVENNKLYWKNLHNGSIWQRAERVLSFEKPFVEGVNRLLEEIMFGEENKDV